ncbi:hypothetical protein D3C78_684260 [compost metagenome]
MKSLQAPQGAGESRGRSKAAAARACAGGPGAGRQGACARPLTPPRPKNPPGLCSDPIGIGAGARPAGTLLLLLFASVARVYPVDDGGTFALVVGRRGNCGWTWCRERFCTGVQRNSWLSHVRLVAEWETAREMRCVVTRQSPGIALYRESHSLGRVVPDDQLGYLVLCDA